jgi:hypothetical protein
MTIGTPGSAGAPPNTAGEAGNAARAYLRLPATVRAVLEDPVRASLGAVPATPIAEADEALSAAGLAGNEWAFLRLVAHQAQGHGPGGQDTPHPGP